MRVEFTVSETPVSDYLIGLDIGTSMSKAALFDRRGREVGATGRRTRVRSPHPGWNEMEAEDLFAAAAGACRELLAETRVDPKDIRGLGISASHGRRLADRCGGRRSATRHPMERWPRPNPS